MQEPFTRMDAVFSGLGAEVGNSRLCLTFSSPFFIQMIVRSFLSDFMIIVDISYL
jgi:hypothetical protein